MLLILYDHLMAHEDPSQRLLLLVALPILDTHIPIATYCSIEMMRSVGCDFSSEKVIRRLQWGSRTVILYCSKRVENLYQQQRNLYRKWPRQTIPLINPMMPCNTEPERDIQGLTNDEVKAHKVYNPIRRLLTMSDFQPTTPSSSTLL